MPITIEWINEEKTVLLERFEGQWSLDDYFRLVDQAADHLDTVPHTVHIIADGTRSRLPPTRLFSGARYAARRKPPNQGITVFVGIDAFTETLIHIANRLLPGVAGTLRVVNTMAEAEQIIAQLPTSAHAYPGDSVEADTPANTGT
ncbi:MAG: hypothetical protein JXQ72_08590 [Anaerolineae bacterium]|nr:hypothetical protein [Anaerolineae bacterium]